MATNIVLTDHHERELEAFLDRLAVDLVRKVGEPHVPLDLLGPVLAAHPLLVVLLVPL